MGTGEHDVMGTEVGQRAPILDEPRVTRRRQVALIAGGALAGFVIGAVVVLLIDRSRVSGDSDDPAVWMAGLPVLLMIPGAVIGAVLAGMRNVPDVDAPMRLRSFRRRGRAATSEQGQLPGSEVPPEYHPERAAVPAPDREPGAAPPVDPTAEPPVRPRIDGPTGAG